VSLDHIAAVERADSRLDEAVATWQKSLAITEEAQALEPTNHNLRREVAVAYQRIGDAEKARGALGAALDAYNSDLKIMRGLTASDHTRLGWAQDLLNSLFRVGDSLVANSEFEQALGIYEEGLGAAQQLCRQAIEQPDRRAVAAFYHQLSETLIKMRRYESAVERARQATAFFREVFRTHAEQRERLSQTLGNDAWYQLLAGHPSEALATAEEAIGLSPDFLALRVNKLHALVLTGRSAAAAAYYSASQAMEASGQPHLADMLLADLAEFRKSGISETDVQSIVEAFQLPQP
jgi:tetratricopeptide (TPR) repeat protein